MAGNWTIHINDADELVPNS